MSFAAVLEAPFGRLGIEITGPHLSRLVFLPRDATPKQSADPGVRCIAQALEQYWTDPGYCFDLPLMPQGSPFRLKVWQALAQIPVGTTITYGDLAGRLGSSARAVGQALGDNPLPIVVPCHRVVSASGGLGGFNHSRSGYSIDIKRWLLTHEGVL